MLHRKATQPLRELAIYPCFVACRNVSGRLCSNLFLVFRQFIGTETILLMLLRNIKLNQSVLDAKRELHACAEVWM